VHMTIFPAIDLRAGCVVRLRQGRASEQVTYSDDPAAVAARWQAEGAAWLHVVDLDAALSDSRQTNASALRRIRAAVRVPIQFGGGLRDVPSVARAFDLGVDRVVIGTMAIEKPQLLAEVVTQFGGDKILVAMDTLDGRMALRGWQALSNVDGVEFGNRMRVIGIQRAVVTDISRDGMLTGTDAYKLLAVARETGLSVIASGGIAALDDLRALARFESDGIEGAIVGQALYSGALSLSEAIRELRPHAQPFADLDLPRAHGRGGKG
jgi:phosphoribosylformimino-5-aminoimidazole carboxamide ribotide isomerase